jgi:hypothetical protein
MGCWLLGTGQRIYKKDEQNLGVDAMRIFFPIKSQIVIDMVRVEGWGVPNTDLSNISIFNLAEGWRVRDERWGVRGKGRGTWDREGGMRAKGQTMYYTSSQIRLPYEYLLAERFAKQRQCNGGRTVFRRSDGNLFCMMGQKARYIWSQMLLDTSAVLYIQYMGQFYLGRVSYILIDRKLTSCIVEVLYAKDIIQNP